MPYTQGRSANKKGVGTHPKTNFKTASNSFFFNFTKVWERRSRLTAPLTIPESDQLHHFS